MNLEGEKNLSYTHRHLQNPKLRIFTYQLQTTMWFQSSTTIPFVST